MRIPAFGVLALALVAAACSSSPTRTATSSGATAAPSGMADTGTMAARGDRIDQFAAEVEMRRGMRR
jgi:hypothetical protein